MADDTDVLPDLDPELGALISAYETATARDAAQVDAALARVTARVGTAASAGAAGLSVTTKIGIVGGLFGVVAVAGIVALGPSNESTSSRTAATPSIVVDDPPRSVAVDAVVPHVDAAPSASVIPAEEAPADLPRATSDRRVNSRAPAPDTAPSKSAQSDSLKAELELLRQARGALRDGRAERALEIVLQHRRDYPSSAVAEERDATEVSALCALGRHDDAKTKAAALERRSSRSAEDLLGACR